MKLSDLVKQLELGLKRPLPGPVAHEPMRAVPAGSVIPKFEHKLPPKPGSILILLYEDESGNIKFPLIKRPDYLGAHSGQVSFPGGKAEVGETPVETALREAEEEIGIGRNEVTVIGQLSDFFVIPSNFMVKPIVGYTTTLPVFVPDKIEVSRVMEGDLLSILPDSAVQRKEITAAGRFQMMATHFEIDGEVVWGATAMMLNELRMVVKELLG